LCWSTISPLGRYKDQEISQTMKKNNHINCHFIDLYVFLTAMFGIADSRQIVRTGSLYSTQGKGVKSVTQRQIFLNRMISPRDKIRKKIELSLTILYHKMSLCPDNFELICSASQRFSTVPFYVIVTVIQIILRYWPGLWLHYFRLI